MPPDERVTALFAAQLVCFSLRPTMAKSIKNWTSPLQGNNENESEQKHIGNETGSG